MRAILVPMVLAVGVTTLSQSSPPASAKGCLKGAVIGGVAGPLCRSSRGARGRRRLRNRPP
jgi:hypothetical protein